MRGVLKRLNSPDGWRDKRYTCAPNRTSGEHGAQQSGRFASVFPGLLVRFHVLVYRKCAVERIH